MHYFTNRQINTLVSKSKKQVDILSNPKISTRNVSASLKLDLKNAGMEENFVKNSIFFKRKYQNSFYNSRYLPLILIIKGGEKKNANDINQDLLLIGNIIQALDLNFVLGTQLDDPYTNSDCLKIYFRGMPKFSSVDSQEHVNSYLAKLYQVICKIEACLSFFENKFSDNFNIQKHGLDISSIYKIPGKYLFIESEEYKTNYLEKIMNMMQFNSVIQIIDQSIEDIKNEFSFSILPPFVSKTKKIEAANALQNMIMNHAIEGLEFVPGIAQLKQQFPVFNTCLQPLLLRCEEQIAICAEENMHYTHPNASTMTI